MNKVYIGTHYAARLFYKVVFRMSATGLENLPAEGGYIIAPNHASFFDPPAIGCTIPREMAFFAKKELFSIPILGWWIAKLNSIPVDRHGDSSTALRIIIDLLKKGLPILLFPEGTRTRTGEFLEPKKGVGMIASMVGVPIVPCWIEGSYKAFPFLSKITLHFLPPFHPDEIEAPSKKEHYLLVSKRIMSDITNLHDKQLALKKA